MVPMRALPYYRGLRQCSYHVTESDTTMSITATYKSTREVSACSSLLGLHKCLVHFRPFIKHGNVGLRNGGSQRRGPIHRGVMTALLAEWNIQTHNSTAFPKLRYPMKCNLDTSAESAHPSTRWT